MGLLSLAPTAGTQPDIVSRLASLMPTGWFPDTTPVLDGLLNGLAATSADLVTLLTYTQAQTRIATATDTFLDMVALDFFGSGIVRGPEEPDSSLRTRIQRGLLPPQATRAAVYNALLSLTARAPRMFEPARLEDTGAYGVAATLAYGGVGGYGSFALPFQCFITAYRPIGSGVAETNGYSTTLGGYGVGLAQYTTPEMAASTVLDSDITAAIAVNMPVAATAWTVISN